MSILFLVVLLGAIVGLSVGLIGTGSVLAVPLLVYGAGLGVHASVCVAMVAMTLIGIIGTLQRMHTGAIRFGSAGLIAIFGATTAPAGAWLNKLLPPSLLLVLFALVVLAISVPMLLRRGNHHD